MMPFIDRLRLFPPDGGSSLAALSGGSRRRQATAAAARGSKKLPGEQLERDPVAGMGRVIEPDELDHGRIGDHQGDILAVGLALMSERVRGAGENDELERDQIEGEPVDDGRGVQIEKR